MAKSHDPLLVRVCVELGRGHIREDWIEDKREFVDGYIEGGTITVNPVPATVDTVIHEILHRLFPEWKEPYVRNRTTYLLRRMSDAEIRAFYTEYQQAVTRQRKRVRGTSRAHRQGHDGGASGQVSDGAGGTRGAAVGEVGNGGPPGTGTP